MDVPSGLDVDLDRRRVLRLLGGSVGALAGFKAIDNVVLGYGVLVGTNLTEQDLDAVAGASFGPQADAVTLDDATLRFDDDTITVESSRGTDTLDATDRERARRLDEDHALDGALVRTVEDQRAFAEDAVGFEFSTLEAFFERTRNGDTRPETVERCRGPFFRDVEPATVERFTEADPADPEATVHGLTDGFRRYADYDVPRYLAGSVEDNVLFGAADLRAGFEDPVDFESLLAAGETGMFCYEFVWRSMEAFHAVPAREQTVPVVSAHVFDARHKHVYTALASVLREDGELVVPTTFVDYTHTTMYDDFLLRGVMGEGLEAYNTRHRATRIRWY
ncbi:hypothetical protein [Halomarina rubra]|uniref:Uncharacterized protein n=1 Tax=Halomarina rubra TaxID=2071873 RepID=A0ABD6AT44_9EURY|nr:hypothetical protein [Halomarina rubra]